VLWESKNINGKMTGFTDNYIKVAVDYSEDLINTFTQNQLNRILPVDDLMVEGVGVI